MRIKTIFLLFTFLVGLTFAVENVNAQNKKKTDVSKLKKQSFTLKATKNETSRGDDPNIKDSSQENVKNAEFPGPKEKGANTNTRGEQGVCRVQFDNRTDLKIQVYVDGTFRGIMSPWGDAETYTGAGETRVYAKAVFTDGSSLSWGPSVYMCYPGQFIYFRMDP